MGAAYFVVVVLRNLIRELDLSTRKTLCTHFFQKLASIMALFQVSLQSQHNPLISFSLHFSTAGTERRKEQGCIANQIPLLVQMTKQWYLLDIF